MIKPSAKIFEHKYIDKAPLDTVGTETSQQKRNR